MNRLSTLLVVIALIVPAAAHAAPPPAVGYIFDISASAKPYNKEMLAEQTALVAALPDGVHLLAWSLSDTMNAIADETISDRVRSEVRARFEALPVAGSYTDLGTALTTAVGAVGSRRGHSIVVFTDGNARARRGSRFRGRTFASLLEDRGIVPDDVEVLVRLFGDSDQLIVSRSNVRVLRTPTDWRAALGLPKPSSAPVAVPVPPQAAGRRNAWLVAGGATTIAIGLIVALILVKRTRRPEDEAVTVDTPIDEAATSKGPATTFVVRVTAGDQEQVARLDAERPTVTVGGRYDADLFIGDAARSIVRIELGADGRTVSLQNIGEEPIKVGGLKLATGTRQTLPSDYVQVGLGSTHIVHIYPRADELVEQPAAPRLALAGRRG
jgi:hypothetical protein